MIRTRRAGSLETLPAKIVPTLGLTVAFLFVFVNRAVAEDPVSSRHKLSFNRDIRPILADKCFKCHGPDARQRKGKLRLDDERAAKAPAGSGSVAIVPGKIDESELYARITADDPEERMPPKDSGKSLSAAESRGSEKMDRGRGRL